MGDAFLDLLPSWLLRFLFQIDPALALSALVAVAIFGQLYVAYRIWRPRVEIFGKPAKEELGRLGLVVANLSPVGVWLESLEFIVQDWVSNKRGNLTTVHPRTVLPPTSEKHILVHKEVIEACPVGVSGSDYTSIRLWVRIVRRVHERWRTTGWHAWEMRIRANDMHPDVTPVSIAGVRFRSFIEKIKVRILRFRLR
jgi:hypothetical protein